MLNLYYGRADLDREKFMYHQIAKIEANRRVIVLVPDQFTLEAERKAFEELKVTGLMNVEIMSFSRLGNRVLQETGGGDLTFIDELGKHMILRKIAGEQKHNLKVYGSQCEKRDFLERMTALIGEMKQFNVKPEQIRQLLEANKDGDEGFMMLKKLEDVGILFEKYEEALKGKYIDTEDYLDLLAEKAGASKFLRDAVIWVDGFDSYTKKTCTILEKLLECGDEVNITFIGNGDEAQFPVAEKAMKKFRQMAMEKGVEVTSRPVPKEFRREIHGEIGHLERNLNAYPWELCLEEPEAIHLYACADFYSEAETVAAGIMDLVERKGYRFREIGVVCNDIESRGAVLKRVLDKNGIACFMDEKRGVVHNPFIQFILSLWEAVRWGYRYEDMFRLIRTGLLDLTIDEGELLENYVLKYGIRGGSWKKDFFLLEEKGQFFGGKTEADVGNGAEDLLEQLNDIRSRVMNVLLTFEERMKPCKTGGEMTHAFYGFLRDEAGLAERLEEAVERLKEIGDYDHAQETAQIWNRTVSIMRQMGELTQDVEMDIQTYFEILSAGFEALEIGVIPTTSDQVLVGNLQRTKTGGIKALFVMGVNDGVLPAGNVEEGLFHDLEKQRIAEMGVELCRNDEMRREEETLAIYKMFSRPTEFLQMSYTVKGSDDGEMKPSVLAERIRKLFPRLREKKGLFTGGAEEAGYEFQSRVNYMLSHEGWETLLEVLEAGVNFSNDKKALEQSAFDLVYPQMLLFSPTSIEQYSRCPFSHFMKYGIRADERRIFEVAAPEMGTIFHETLMRFSRQMTEKYAWSNLTEDRCGLVIEEILKETLPSFRKGVLFENEIGRYRVDRIRQVCKQTAWMVADHINRGQFREFHFEADFGRGGYLPPMEIETDGKRPVFLEGRIDRIDVMNDGADQYVKIVDYKSGSDKVDKKEILMGYRMQLMLYMNAVMKGLSKRRREKQIKPAGVFYFKIQEPNTNAESKEGLDWPAFLAYLEKERVKAFKMDGIVVNENKVIEGLDEDFSGFSEIIRVRKLKNGDLKGTGEFSALTPDEFRRLQNHVDHMTERLCRNFARGRVEVAPKMVDTDTVACTFCKYKGICMFDRACKGFSFVRE